MNAEVVPINKEIVSQPWTERVFTIEREMDAATYGITTPEQYAASCTQVDAQIAGWNRQHEINIAFNEHLFLAERSFGDLINAHPKSRFLVLGRGPSLARRRDQVIQARKLGFKIISVDAASPLLFTNGIEPDYAIGFDCQDVCGTFHRPFEITNWILRMSCSPNLTGKVPSEKRFWYASATPCSTMWREVQRKYRRFNWLREWSTVIHSAVDAAYKMGAETIVALGNDLLYHTVFDPEGNLDLSEILCDRANGENIILFDNCQHATKDSFKSQADALGQFPNWYKDCRFFDLGGGLIKPGWAGINKIEEAL